MIARNPLAGGLILTLAGLVVAFTFDSSAPAHGGFSIADCMYAPVVSRLRTYGVSLPAASAAYVKRMWGLPAMQGWLKDCEEQAAVPA